MTMNTPEKGWEEEFYKLTELMDGQYRPQLKLLISSLEQVAYDRGVSDQAAIKGERRRLIEQLKAEVEKEAYEKGLKEMAIGLDKELFAGLSDESNGLLDYVREEAYQKGLKEGAEGARRAVREEIEAKQKSLKGKGGHGKCCMCRDCKQFNDDCTCAEIATMQVVLSLPSLRDNL